MLSIREFRKIQEPGTRRCSKCGKIKPIEEFVKNGTRTPDGRMSKCKECHRLQSRERIRDPKVKEKRQKALHNWRKRQNETTKQMYPQEVEFIYIFKWQIYYKIGRAKNPQSRIKSINASLPFIGEIICIIPTNNMLDAELYLHDLYSSTRQGGEWFELSSDDVNSLCSINFIQVDNHIVKIIAA